jgi:sulfite reductase beta subunit-like hemoprotein
MELTVTTRQTLQLHGILKGDLKTTLKKAGVGEHFA